MVDRSITVVCFVIEFMPTAELNQITVVPARIPAFNKIAVGMLCVCVNFSFSQPVQPEMNEALVLKRYPHLFRCRVYQALPHETRVPYPVIKNIVLL